MWHKTAYTKMWHKTAYMKMWHKTAYTKMWHKTTYTCVFAFIKSNIMNHKSILMGASALTSQCSACVSGLSLQTSYAYQTTKDGSLKFAGNPDHHKSKKQAQVVHLGSSLINVDEPKTVKLIPAHINIRRSATIN